MAMVSRYLKILKYHLFIVSLISSLGIFYFSWSSNLDLILEKKIKLMHEIIRITGIIIELQVLFEGGSYKKNTVCGCTYMHIQSSLVHICIGLGTCICQ